jgi:nitrite reductase/ring-hydroxylating ferredoxin subunit
MPQRLCRVDDVPEGGGRGFRLGAGAAETTVFVIKRAGALYAYRNACPHTGTPLDWIPDRFFDVSGRYLLCSTHGALFRPEDGFCVSGPCAGKRLSAVAIVVAEGEVVMTETLSSRGNS